MSFALVHPSGGVFDNAKKIVHSLFLFTVSSKWIILLESNLVYVVWVLWCFDVDIRCSALQS